MHVDHTSTREEPTQLRRIGRVKRGDENVRLVEYATNAHKVRWTHEDDDCLECNLIQMVHAVIAFGLACKSLRLYGFGGSISLDGHHIMASHGIDEEHALLASLLDPAVAPTLEEMARNAPLRQAWANANVTNVC